MDAQTGRLHRRRQGGACWAADMFTSARLQRNAGTRKSWPHSRRRRCLCGTARLPRDAAGPATADAMKAHHSQLAILGRRDFAVHGRERCATLGMAAVTGHRDHPRAADITHAGNAALLRRRALRVSARSQLNPGESGPDRATACGAHRSPPAVGLAFTADLGPSAPCRGPASSCPPSRYCQHRPSSQRWTSR